MVNGEPRRAGMDPASPSETHPVAPVPDPSPARQCAQCPDRIPDRPRAALRLDVARSSGPTGVAGATAAVFSLAILTDSLDEYLARKNNLVT